MSREVKTVYVYPPQRGTGNHDYFYMSFYVGDEMLPNTPRGWGQTEREAKGELEKRRREDEEQNK